ncbi:uncharacterized protein BO87DRAFT_194698 [Aspergillus neoniger CBS 115656]|uniref:Uncharacterized protein n=1 Tax=Aspergillus neoniger (strain CBS 115656) TaxID=1448310 RepID=A0A318Y5X1_ASPNB|nr:hypothetical protein BO87DRAFT_194698 [Aspergillus neoniger CBS 115656]PYH29269.1 hypothetical protein BO87DRAFT_194698 [Aspergillus neoniger CBS 115656]
MIVKRLTNQGTKQCRSGREANGRRENKSQEAFRVGFLSRSHWLPHLQPEVCTGRTPQATLFAFCRVL